MNPVEVDAGRAVGAARARRANRAIQLAAAVVLAALGVSCSGRSIESVDEEFTQVSRQLRDDIGQLRSDLASLKDSWDTEEQSGQADAHWQTLIEAIKLESQAKEACRRGELSEAQAVSRIREQGSKVVASVLTVRSIRARVEQLRFHTRLVDPRMGAVRGRRDRVRAALTTGSLSPEEAQLQQAKFELANRRLSEVESLLKQGLTWFLQDAERGKSIVTTGLQELSSVDVTFREIEKVLVGKLTAPPSSPDEAAGSEVKAKSDGG